MKLKFLYIHDSESETPNLKTLQKIYCNPSSFLNQFWKNEKINIALARNVLSWLKSCNEIFFKLSKDDLATFIAYTTQSYVDIRKYNCESKLPLGNNSEPYMDYILNLMKAHKYQKHDLEKELVLSSMLLEEIIETDKMPYAVVKNKKLEKNALREMRETNVQNIIKQNSKLTRKFLESWNACICESKR